MSRLTADDVLAIYIFNWVVGVGRTQAGQLAMVLAVDGDSLELISVNGLLPKYG